MAKKPEMTQAEFKRRFKANPKITFGRIIDEMGISPRSLERYCAEGIRRKTAAEKLRRLMPLPSEGR
jgi:hypothetical protein